jgi:IclR family pca regulon transcriptional regulator
MRTKGEKVRRPCRFEFVQPKSKRKKLPQSTDFVESLARGIDVIKAFTPTKMELTVSDVAVITSLARPTARRLLLTLEKLGYVRLIGSHYMLTPKTLELGTSYVSSQGMWDVVQPHLVALVEKTGESSSMSELDGSDIVYTARVPVAKIIGLSVHIGTRFPAISTSMGMVMLADLDSATLERVLKLPSNSGVIPRITPSRKQIDLNLAKIRKQKWALSDEQLSYGIRSVAAPVHNMQGKTIAAINVTVNAAETTLNVLTEKYLPLLIRTASDITNDFVTFGLLPTTEPLTK